METEMGKVMIAKRTPSVSFESSPTSPIHHGGLWGRFINKINLSSVCDGQDQTPSAARNRRIIQGDEEQEFQSEKTHCLSSYYSVFVARLAIMVMLAILIGMLTILTWHITRAYTTKSINSLAYGLRFELLQRPVLRMWNILNSTVEITMAQVKLCEYVIHRYDMPVTHPQKHELYQVMRDVTWALFASRKALNAITIRHRNGFVQAFHRDHRSNNTYYIYSDPTHASYSGWNESHQNGNISAIWYREPLDPLTGIKIGLRRQVPPDDLIKIAGFSEVRDGSASWQVTVSKFTDSPLLSAALPVLNSSDGSIMAVVGVTTAFYSVGQLMRELVEFHSGYMYLTSKEGYLLATSTESPLLRNTTSGPKLMMATDSEDEIIRSGAKWLQQAYKNKFLLKNELHAENVVLGHHKYYVDSFFLGLTRLPLVGVVIIPRKYVMGKVDESALTTLVILITASLCILVIGCVCIMIFTSGVSKEMKLRAELISHLDARRRAEASSNYKSQFLANMSHELRTPMAAVIGLLDVLICDDCLTNEQFATVTQIRKCSTALLRLLNNILDLSKVESGKLVLEDAEFDLGRELEGIVDMFSVQCINHNVETILDLSDDMPKFVRGDSARVVQIFANLISNSIKFTSSGHIILRGWCNNSKDKMGFHRREPKPPLKAKSRQQGSLPKGTTRKDNQITLHFEVDDTGCGIDPSKWESVFESFEQADPSTTRTHGGTGLGLCIVRTLVNKMGGNIRVTKKDGLGTLMKLNLVLSASADSIEQNCQVEFGVDSLMVLLAINGNTGRCIMSKWLSKKRVYTKEASEWNELTQSLQEIFQGGRVVESTFTKEYSSIDPLRLSRVRALNSKTMKTPYLVIVVDIALLDLSTDIWKEQLNFLETYQEKATFAWILNHDTSNAIKMELRRKGHVLMVNKPLYKSKMVHILEAVAKERHLEMQRKLPGGSTVQDLCECHDTDHIHFDAPSSDESDLSEVEAFDLQRGKHAIEEENQSKIQKCSTTCNEKNPILPQLSDSYTAQDCKTSNGPGQQGLNKPFGQLPIESSEKKLATRRIAESTCCSPQPDEQQATSAPKTSEKRSLEGLCILLAEDTPVLQKVATIMLEKMGATVVTVGDGVQAVEALKCILGTDNRSHTQVEEIPKFDLILMDCQMPKMDGYEATKAIRRSEDGTGSHIPIVALTAHAMSSDEAKCLEVGMDAYLTKPIDYKLMVSTILSLTKRVS